MLLANEESLKQHSISFNPLPPMQRAASSCLSRAHLTKPGFALPAGSHVLGRLHAQRG